MLYSITAFVAPAKKGLLVTVGLALVSNQFLVSSSRLSPSFRSPTLGSRDTSQLMHSHLSCFWVFYPPYP